MIIGLGFLLLMLAFRSLLVPAVAAVMNLLAAGAAFGVMVAVHRTRHRTTRPAQPRPRARPPGDPQPALGDHLAKPGAGPQHNR